MNTGEFAAVVACMIIPVIGLVYVRVMGKILRRSGVTPIEEQIASLKTADPEASEPMALRKAA